MTLRVADLARTPNALAPHYAHFRVSERLLLTGHSHQAWPDVAREGQLAAWEDAAALVDEKWALAEEKAERVRRGFARLLDVTANEIVLGANTHELLLRFLSALPLARRPTLVTTDGEFHTIRRQLDRLAEAGVRVVKVPASPATEIAARLTAVTDDRTAAVLVSSVLYANAHVVPGLPTVLARCQAVGAELLVDAYHAVNAVPVSLPADGLSEAFVVGGGYKYCQLGEGNCFLRVPPGRTDLRPVITGWFSEFAALAERADQGVGYGAGPARWAGSTYDPTSHYRAERVFAFFHEHQLAPELLRAVSQHQVGVLARRFDALDTDPAVITRDRAVPLERVGGFLALRSPQAERLRRSLRARGVLTDHRGDLLRLGPAPYLSDAQLDTAMDALAESLAGPR